MLEEYNTIILGLIGRDIKTPIEIEAIWGCKTLGVPYVIFHNLRSKLNEMSVPEYTDKVDRTLSNGVRETERHDGTKEFIMKERLGSYSNDDYGVTLIVSEEKNVTQSIDINTSVRERRKKRWTYVLFGGDCKADLTEVDQTDFTEGESSVRYEIELELLDLTKLNQFYTQIETFHCWIYDTNTLYTIKQKEATSREFNIRTGSQSNVNVIDTNQIPKPRDLKYDDLVYGGIVGNKVYNYTLRHKIDGVTKLFIINQFGLWAVTPPYMFNLIHRNIADELHGLILYGQYLPPKDLLTKGVKSVLQYIITDVIYNGLDPMTHIERLEWSRNVVAALNEINTDLFHFSIISLYQLTPIEFYTVILKAYQSLDATRYKTDGFIITPNNAPFQPHTDKRDRSERDLTLYPDLCRLKVKGLNSIDLQLVWNMENRPEVYTQSLSLVCVDIPFITNNKLSENRVVTMLWSNADKALKPIRLSDKKTPYFEQRVKEKLKDAGGIKDVYIDLLYSEGKLYAQRFENVPFKGSMMYPFSQDSIEINEIIIDKPSGSIIEFVLPSKSGKLTPYRYRSDREHPGQQDDTVDVWNLMNDPITEESFTGSTLFYKHIERVIRSIVNTYTEMKIVTNDQFKKYERYSSGDKTLVLFGTLDRITDLIQPGMTVVFVDWDPTALEVYQPIDLVIQPPSQPFIDMWNSLIEKNVIVKNVKSIDTDELLKEEYRSVASFWCRGVLEVPSDYIVIKEPQTVLSPIKPIEVALPIIPVNTPNQRSIHTHAYGDDIHLPLKCSWYNGNLVRIGTIGDGSCFFHSYLKGFYTPYQNTPFFDERSLIVRNFRNDLAFCLPYNIPGTEIRVYDAIAEGQLATLGRVEGIEDFYTIGGLQNLLYSSKDVGDEVYSYVADIIRIDVIVLRGTLEDIKKHSSTAGDVERPLVVIVGQGSHYELIGELIDNKIRTLFRPDDEFYIRIKSL